MTTDRQRRAGDVAAGAGFTGAGALTLARANQSVAGVAALREDRLRRQMRYRAGSLGGLDPQGRPVDPLKLSGRRGRHLTPVREAGRYQSPRAEARLRYAAARAPYEAKLARGMSQGARLGVKGAVLATGVSGLYLGGRHLGRAIAPPNARGRKVAKAEIEVAELMPRDVRRPVDPLTMQASAAIMADVLASASGRKVSRRQRRAYRRGATRFVGAQHLTVVPTGFKGLVTA